MLLDTLELVTDPRIERTKLYPLKEVLLSAFIAILDDARSWRDIQCVAENHIDKLREFFDLCGRLPCFDAHCYNAPYISILCGMLDMSRRKTSKPKQIEAFVKNGDLNNRILHRKFQFRAKPCLHCAA